jgi:HEPN domain-containing protein
MREQAERWARNSRADLRVGETLVKARKMRHALYLFHLAIEKLLKALACKATRKPATRTRSLPVLAEQAGVVLQPEQMSFLTRLDRFGLARCGPENPGPIPRAPQAVKLTQDFRKVYRYLAKHL